MNGMISLVEYKETPVASPTHPCVFKTLTALADQGTLPGGMLFALNASSQVIPYDRAGAAPANVLKGVLARELDTTEDTAAIGIVHGTVVTDLLSHGTAGDAVTQADIQALEAITIYPQ